MKRIDVRPSDLNLVKQILAERLPEFDVYAFGSRVKGCPRETSDLDLAVMTGTPLETLRLADLKEAFSDSEIPFKVDVVDWAATGENFREIIQKDWTLIHSGQK